MRIVRQFVFGALLFAGAIPAHADTVVRAVLGGQLQNLDPIFSTSYASRTLGYLAYDTLIARDSHGDFKPQMLESWTASPDALTYVFKLRAGLKWHDGAPVRAADCVASIKRWSKKDGLGGRLIAAAESLAADNDATFTLKLAKPFGLVIDALAKESSPAPFMMPERLANTDIATALTEVDGSGPFKFKADQYVAGSKAVFVKNPAYVPRSEAADGLAGGKVVKIDGVEIEGLTDPQTQVSALENGEIDFLQYVPYDLLPILASDKSIVVARPGAAANSIGLIRFNFLQPPLDSPKVRKAFEMSIDRAEVLSAIGATPDYLRSDCLSFFGCGGVYGAVDDGEPIAPYSLEKAKAAVKASGYSGEKIVLMVGADSITNLAAPVVKSELESAGFQVDMPLMDVETLLSRRTSKAPVANGGWSAFLTYLGTVDIGSPATNAYVTDNFCNPNYAGWSCDAKINDLLGQFLTEPDFAKRKQIATAINSRAHESLPAVLWGQFTTPLAYRRALIDVVDAPTPVFWSMRKP